MSVATKSITQEAQTTSAQIPPCPACEGSDFGRRFVKNERHFWRCVSCGLEKQHPLPTVQELEAYYDASYRDGMYKDFVDAAEMKRMTAEYRLKKVRQHIEGGRMLDVGCSNGQFLAAARAAEIDAEGIDLSIEAVNQAVAAGLPAHHSTIDDWRPDYLYDSITMFDVLEHVIDPVDFLSSVKRLLKPNGTIVITVPNLDSITRLVMGSRWYFYIPEEHLHYFGPSVIRRLLDRLGFDVVDVTGIGKPLSFDYSMSQFEVYNPLIHALLTPLRYVLPRKLRTMPVPLHIGEMKVVARLK